MEIFKNALNYLRPLLELLFSMGLLLNALSFVPQIVRLHKLKDSRSCSITMFHIFWVTQLLTIIHGYFHQDYRLMSGYLLCLIPCLMVVFLIYKYRN